MVSRGVHSNDLLDFPIMLLVPNILGLKCFGLIVALVKLFRACICINIFVSVGGGRRCYYDSKVSSFIWRLLGVGHKTRTI